MKNQATKNAEKLERNVPKWESNLVPKWFFLTPVSRLCPEPVQGGAGTSKSQSFIKM